MALRTTLAPGNVIMDANVTVTATRGYTTYEHLLNINASGVRNVTIVSMGTSGTGAAFATTSIFRPVVGN